MSITQIIGFLYIVTLIHTRIHTTKLNLVLFVIKNTKHTYIHTKKRRTDKKNI